MTRNLHTFNSKISLRNNLSQPQITSRWVNRVCSQKNTIGKLVAQEVWVKDGRWSMIDSLQSKAIAILIWNPLVNALRLIEICLGVLFTWPSTDDRRPLSPIQVQFGTPIEPASLPRSHRQSEVRSRDRHHNVFPLFHVRTSYQRLLHSSKVLVARACLVWANRVDVRRCREVCTLVRIRTTVLGPAKS